MKRITWHRVSAFFEYGDLVPFAVVVSAWHFIQALTSYSHESTLVAVAMGIFVDMLHFRTVRYAVRGRNKAAVIIALATTLVSYGFHLLFYLDGQAFNSVYLLLAAPLPLGIPVLAWQQEQAHRPHYEQRLLKRAKVLLNLAKEWRKAAKAAEIRTKAHETRLQESETAVKRLESRVTDLERLLKEAENLRKAADKERMALEARMNRLNPMAQDVVRLITGLSNESQAEIAARHGVSEAAVSRLKGQLNGRA